MDKKIRIIFKQKDVHALILWAKITKTGLMVSQTVNEAFLLHQFPTGKEFHRHDIYFKNGDFHTSIKFYDQLSGKFIDRKIYPNHISIKSSKNKNFTDSKIVKIPRSEAPSMDSLMADFFLTPWSDDNMGHCFNTLATTYRSNMLTGFQPFDIGDFQESTDLLVDVNDHKKQTINVGACIFKIGNTSFGYNNYDATLAPVYKEMTVDDVVVSVGVVFAPIEPFVLSKLKEIKASLFTVVTSARWLNPKFKVFVLEKILRIRRSDL